MELKNTRLQCIPCEDCKHDHLHPGPDSKCPMCIYSGIEKIDRFERAELKAMNAEEILDKMNYPVSLEEGLDYGDECIKNGQIKEWLRPEQVELREAVESVINFFEAWDAEEKHLKRIYDAFENLKPPTMD